MEFKRYAEVPKQAREAMILDYKEKREKDGQGEARSAPLGDENRCRAGEGAREARGRAGGCPSEVPKGGRIRSLARTVRPKAQKSRSKAKQAMSLSRCRTITNESASQ